MRTCSRSALARRNQGAAAGACRKWPLLVWLGCISLAGAAQTVIRIDAAHPAAKPIPRTIFGTFLEPIGHSIYGGLWAQLLENPSLEDNLWSVENIREMVAGEPALTRSSELGLPLPWEPLDATQGARYEPRWGDAANSSRSLLVMGLPQQTVGIRQRVWLPVHRTLHYTGSLFARRLSGTGRLEISFRRHAHPEGILARARVEAKGGVWQRYTFRLDAPEGQIAPLEPVDFVIAVTGPDRILLDQVFLFPTDQVDGMDPEAIAMARELNSPLVRYGGNFTSGYHWQDGIGPIDRRVTKLNQAWGMPEYNHFGTGEFLDFCRRIGAQPQIALNLGSGTPEEAAAWVRYTNTHWNGRGGLLWELGNELWADFQIGYPTIAAIADRTRMYSEAIRRVDASARLIATGQDPDHFRDWNAQQLTLPRGTFQYLSTHFVVGPAEVRKPNPTSEFVALSAFALPAGLERLLREMNAQSHTPTAFTEWLFWARDDTAPRYDNMGGAICTAGFLNMLLRVSDITPIADMTGLMEFGGIWKKRGRIFGTPAYWAFRMYSRAAADLRVPVENSSDTYDVSQGNRRIPEIPGVPYLDVVAAVSRDRRRLTLFAVNRNLDRNVEAQIRVDGFAARPQAHVLTLAARSIYDTNTEENPDGIRPAESESLAPGPYVFRHASVTVMEWTAAQ